MTISGIRNFIVGSIFGIIVGAGGYMLHLKIHDPLRAQAIVEMVGGDINRVNRMGLITDPEQQKGLINMRITEYMTISSWAIDYSKTLGDNEILESLINISKVMTKSVKVSKDPKAAVLVLEEQIQVGKAYVKAVDAYLNKATEMDMKLAALRDMFATFCLQNAQMTCNDAEIDYWQNINALVDAESMAILWEASLEPAEEAL